MPDQQENQSQKESNPAPAAPKRKFPLIETFLIVNAAAVLAMMGMFMGYIPKPGDKQSKPVESRSALSKNVSENSTPKKSEPVKVGKNVSWKDAEKARTNKDFPLATEMFARLAKRARKKPADKFIADFFLLRQAQCMIQTDKQITARGLLRHISQCHSPVVRSLACYELALADFREQKFLSARKNAYRSLAALGALENPIKLNQDCQYLIAKSLTEKVRSFTQSAHVINWPAEKTFDPFIKMNRVQLRKFLTDGSETLVPSSLGPDVKITAVEEMPGRYNIASHNMSVDNIINRIATATNRNLKWNWAGEKVRNRSVDIFYRDASSQFVAEVTAGSVGLISRFNLDEMILFDPMGNSNLTDVRELLSREARSSWRLFAIRNPEDPRIPIGHLALASLTELSGDKVLASRQYQMLANRFAKSNVAPQALMRCAKIKLTQLDFSGAESDLKEMLDLYPNHAGVDHVYLMIAEVKEREKNFEQAVNIYEMLFHRNLSMQSRKIACLGAGRANYHLGKYKRASDWLARYVANLRKPNSKDYVEAYFLLGHSETARGNYSIARSAFYRGLLGKPGNKAKSKAIFEIALTHIQQEDFVQAIGVLDKLSKMKLTQQQKNRWVLIKAKVLKNIMLYEQANHLLRSAILYSDDEVFKAKLNIALAENNFAAQNFKRAKTILTANISSMPAGKDFNRASVLLAETCLKLNQPKQTISIASKLLPSVTDKNIIKKIRNLLGQSHLKLNEYDKAAVYFSGLATADKTKKGAGK